MDGGIDRNPRLRAHRRLRIGASFVLGTAIGIGVGSVAVLASSLWPLVVLAIPLGLRVVGTASGRMTMPDRAVGWLWPIVALAVALALVLLLPQSIAPFGLAIAVALWIGGIVAAGILDVVVDPDGRMGGVWPQRVLASDGRPRSGAAGTEPGRQVPPVKGPRPAAARLATRSLRSRFGGP